MCRPPPTPTLFPYTTLFRSRLLGALAHAVARPRRACRRHPVEEQDRKSTRLNSSHMSMSYAVFCLKKNTGVVSQLDYSVTSNDGKVGVSRHVVVDYLLVDAG